MTQTVVGYIEPREGAAQQGGAPTRASVASSVNGIEWVELIEVTPEIAAEWLNRYHFEGQRPVRANRVESLALEMRAGRFSTSEMRLVHVGDRGYLTEGQHRLHAVLATRVNILCTVLHHIGHSMEDVADDYIRTDALPGRTMAEQLAATGLIGRAGMNPSAFNLLSRALPPIIGGFMGRAYTNSGDPYLRSPAVRMQAIADFSQAAGRYNDALFGCESSLTARMRHRAVMSVALVTLREQPATAFDFWKSTAENDGLHKGDPRHTLVRFLTTSPMKSNRGAHTSRSVAIAWNAYFKKQKATHLRGTDILRPILIRGTEHYNGKQPYLPYHREDA